MILLKLGSQGPTVSDWQRTLRLAGFGVEVDGEFGPETEAATRAFQKRAGLVVDGEVGDATRNAASHFATVTTTKVPHSFADLLVRIAASQIGTHETSNNQGPGIEKYWRATSYPHGYADRQPWCAAFQCWVVSVAMTDKQLCPPGLIEDTRPKLAGAWAWADEWMPARYPLVSMPDYRRSAPRAGDIVVYTFHHIGLVESCDAQRGAFRAIEGNTNADGSREGKEVLIHPRRFADIRNIIRFREVVK
jgi:hypothetical protein